MKSLILLCLLSATRAFAAGPEGLTFLPDWAGDYEVTRCIQCPNAILASGANLKNFTRFSLGGWQVPADKRLGCAQTDTAIWFSYVTKSDSGAITDGLSQSTGMCDWDYEEKLVVTAQTFDYQAFGKIRGQALTLNLVKTGADTMTLIKHEISATPSFGYPNDYTLEVELKKIK